MFLGMEWHFWIVLAFSLYLLVKIGTYRGKRPAEIVRNNIAFFGGPRDKLKMAVTVDPLPNYVIEPYYPEQDKNADGPPTSSVSIEDNETGEKKIVLKPKYAYYQHVGDGNFFYRRDVTPEEMEIVRETGGLPNE